MNFRRIFVMASNVFQELIRERILYAIAIYALILVISFRLISEFTSTSKEKIFLDLSMAMMNVIGLIIAIIVGTGLVNKEIEKRTVLVLIAKPISRSEFITSKYLGLSAVLAVMIASMTVILLLFLQFSNIPQPTTSIVLGSMFLLLQLTLITAVAITLSVFSTSLLAATLTFAIYLMGNITQDLVELGRLGHNPVLEKFTQGLYLILPDLSRLDLKNHIVYGMQALPQPMTLIINAVYGLLYSVMLLGISILLFSRREF